jgi:hypothetical protein
MATRKGDGHRDEELSAVDCVAAWGALLAEALVKTGGPLTDEERAWADDVLGDLTYRTARRAGAGSIGVLVTKASAIPTIRD